MWIICNILEWILMMIIKNLPVITDIIVYFKNGLDKPTKTIGNEKLYLSIWCSHLLRIDLVDTSTNHPRRSTFLLSFNFLLVRCLIIFFILDHQTTVYMHDHFLFVFQNVLLQNMLRKLIYNVTICMIICD